MSFGSVAQQELIIKRERDRAIHKKRKMLQQQILYILTLFFISEAASLASNHDSYEERTPLMKMYDGLSIQSYIQQNNGNEMVRE